MLWMQVCWLLLVLLKPEIVCDINFVDRKIFSRSTLSGFKCEYSSDAIVMSCSGVL